MFSEVSSLEIENLSTKSPEEYIEKKDALERIYGALTALTALERDVVILKFFAGLNNVEAAQALRSTVSAVKTRQSRAISKLRMMFNPDASIEVSTYTTGEKAT